MPPFGMGRACPKRYTGLQDAPASQRWLSEVRASATDLTGSGAGPIPNEGSMRFYTGQHRFYCGVDLHARTMYLSILDEHGATVLDRNLPARGDVFLQAVGPY